MAATVVLAVAVLLNWKGEGPSSVPEAVAATVRDYVRLGDEDLPLRFVGNDPDAVRDGLRREVSFDFQLPDFRTQPIETLGGRICPLPDGNGINLVYRVEGRKIAYYVFQDPGIDLGRHPTIELGANEAHLASVGGYQVVFWKSGEVICTFVSGLSMEELVALLGASYNDI